MPTRSPISGGIRAVPVVLRPRHLRRNPLGERQERRFEVDLVFLEQRQLVAGGHECRGQVAVVLLAVGERYGEMLLADFDAVDERVPFQQLRGGSTVQDLPSRGNLPPAPPPLHTPPFSNDGFGRSPLPGGSQTANRVVGEGGLDEVVARDGK